MFRGRAGRQGGNSINVPLKGFFSDGVWRCNCQPRLPAEHFQTKNGGKNHGRWFYTCQQPQPKRCNFFLWDDEAKPREEAVVLSNSRSEPRSSPATPSRGGFDSQSHKQTFEPARSPSRAVSRSPAPRSSANPPKATIVRDETHVDDNKHEDFYDWPLSDKEELQISEVVDQASTCFSGSLGKASSALQTPRKAARTDACTSPGKRQGYSTKQDDNEIRLTPGVDDPFVTPFSSSPRKRLFVNTSEPETPTSKANGRSLMSPSLTPTPNRYRNISATKEEDSALATEILSLLDSNRIDLTRDIRGELVQLLNTHAVQAQGVVRGRDISRLALKTKELDIGHLQQRIAYLEAERETDKAVIRHLRHEKRSRNVGDCTP